MDGNMSARNMMPGSYGMVELQGGSMHNYHQQQPQASMHHHHHPQQQQQQQQQLQQHNHPHPHPHRPGSLVHPPMHDIFPMPSGHMHECEQQLPTIPMMDYNKVERTKTPTSDEDEPSYTEEGADGHNEGGKGKKASPWQRMKWTDAMVKLLITAVSYIGEDGTSECNASGRRKMALLQKKGKWKLVSKVMAERGCYVSPQQCEDKFNDLNKRYKRLNDILGRGTSCEVVENPALLDLMDHISEKAKEDVRKILSSKHLFYEEMCSYHNGNRLHLPADPALQRSLQLALRSGDDHDTRRAAHDDLNEDDHGMDSDDKEDISEEHHTLHGDIGGLCSHKRTRSRVDHEDMGFGNTVNSQDSCRKSHPQSISVDMNQVFPEGSKTAYVQKEWLSSRSLQLEEQRLHIQTEMLALEKQRFKWQRFSKKKDRELDKMRMENERMKLENERMALELRRKELDIERS